MPGEMFGHEGRDEIITMVVTGLPPKRQRNSRLGACLAEQIGAKLLVQELVGGAEIHQQVIQPGAVLDERDAVVLAPRRTILSKIAAQRLLSPRHLAGSDDWRESRDAAEALGKIECDSQCSVATHRVAGNALPAEVDGEFGGEQLWQFVSDIGPHPKVPGPGLKRCIDVEARALAEVVPLSVGHVVTA